jgi:hypothetical protein
MEKGTLLKTKTKTLNDVFGEVVWEVAETGMLAPEPERKGQMDGVKCVMLGGTGPSARPGFQVLDSEARIQADIAAGITTVVPEAAKAKLMDAFRQRKEGKKCTSGVEVDY